MIYVSIVVMGIYDNLLYIFRLGIVIFICIDVYVWGKLFLLVKSY